MQEADRRRHVAVALHLERVEALAPQPLHRLRREAHVLAMAFEKALDAVSIDRPAAAEAEAEGGVDRRGAAQVAELDRLGRKGRVHGDAVRRRC